MKITVTKVIQELQEKHGWEGIHIDERIIKDVLNIIDQKLKYHKGISIK